MSKGVDRNIVHLDLDSFFVSVERLLNSGLNGKPVIVGGSSDRGVVAACSYEARAFGVHSAMPIRAARNLCPQAIFVRGDYEQYSKYSAMVSEIIASRSPLFEKASIDEHYIDLTGMERYFGTLKWSKQIRQFIISETGLPVSFGLSVNKTVAKIATDEAKPNGELEVSKEKVRAFLNPLSVKKIPMVGEKTFQVLQGIGVNTIESLSNLPLEYLIKVLGEHGRILWQKANGICYAAVDPYTERKSISTETTFSADTFDMDKLNTTLVRMVEELCFGLRKEGRVCACVAVKVRYSDFDTHTQQIKIAYTSNDHVILPRVKELFLKLYNKHLPLRLIGVRLSQLASGHRQIDLFDDREDLVSLYQAIDRVKLRYGEKSLIKAIGLKPPEVQDP